MALPSHFQCMPFVLQCLADGQAHTLQEMTEYCAKAAQLTPEQRNEKMGSGKNHFYDRVSWAATYLRQAGLVQSPRRGISVITAQGQKALEEKQTIDLQFLNQFSSFVQFHSTRKRKEDKIESGAQEQIEVSPVETIDNALSQLNTVLSSELIEQIFQITPYQFEILVTKLLIKMGYGNPHLNESAVTQKSHDDGIDGVITQDKLGFDSIYIQAKRWKPDHVVGQPEIQKFLGALVGQGATKGLFITTSKYSREAVAYSNKQLTSKIILVDGEKLTQLMIEHNIGVSTINSFEIKRLDTDFFNEELKEF